MKVITPNVLKDILLDFKQKESELMSNIKPDISIEDLKNDFLDKETYTGSEDGIVKEADLAKGLDINTSNPGEVYMHSSIDNKLGFHALINLDSSETEEPIITSLTKSVPYVIELTGHETTTNVQVSEYVENNTNVDGVINSYMNIGNVYGDKENLDSDENGIKIKNEYEIESNINNDGFYEYDLSSLDTFINVENITEKDGE